MILQIMFKGAKADSSSMNYINIAATNWSIVDNLLAVVKANGSVRYYPLSNIESFMEVEDVA